MGGQVLLLLIGLKLGHDDLTANIVIFGCSGPPGTIDGIKNFNKGNQATKH